MKNIALLYVPILKSRRAEMKALQYLEDEHKDKLLPLIEVVLPVPSGKAAKGIRHQSGALEAKSKELFLEEPKAAKHKTAKTIYNAWQQRPVIVDFTLLYDYKVKMEGLRWAVAGFKEANMNAIIAFNLIDPLAYGRLVASSLGGCVNKICIRLTRADFNDVGQLNKRLAALVRFLDIDHNLVYILVDLKYITDSVKDSLLYQRIVAKVCKLDNLHKWAQIIISTGSFPVDLTDFSVDQENRCLRSDWMNWSQYVNRRLLPRQFLFSDYTIRHPLYAFKPQFYMPSASIIYTTNRDWRIIRGQRGKFEQYLAGAQIIVGSDFYLQETYSFGDKFIGDKAAYYGQYLAKYSKLEKDKRPKLETGNAESWIRAGLNHHLALSVNQLIALDEAANSP